MTLDAIRRHHPDLGLALYAYEPGGPVTLEVHTPDGQVFTFTGPTEAAVLAKAFGAPDPEPAPEPEEAETTDIFD